MDEAELTEHMRAALMRGHADDWTMDTVSEAAHICAAEAIGYVPLVGDGPHRWDGSMTQQLRIVTWSRGQIEGMFGADTEDGRGPGARYFLLLPTGEHVTAGMGVERVDGRYKAVPS